MHADTLAPRRRHSRSGRETSSWRMPRVSTFSLARDFGWVGSRAPLSACRCDSTAYAASARRLLPFAVASRSSCHDCRALWPRGRRETPK